MYYVEKLVRELREKGESEQEILDEINDLDALLPDVEAKVSTALSCLYACIYNFKCVGVPQDD